MKAALHRLRAAAQWIWAMIHPGSGAHLPLLPHDARLDSFDHLVVVMMENRSFDHYFGARQFLEGKTVDGLSGHETNPGPGGEDVAVHPLGGAFPAPPPHEWAPSHRQYNGGANDGFVREQARLHPAHAADVMGYHTRAELPILYALADAYTTCDRWFASVLGGTWPNRFYLHGGDSRGEQENKPVPGLRTIWHELHHAGIEGVNYYTDAAWMWGAFFPSDLFGQRPTEHISKFFERAATGDLPAYSLLDPGFFSCSDHPPQPVELGQAILATIYAALAKSPAWDRTLLVITFDEHGGFFDHVAPPTTSDPRPEFQQLGFRVPTVVIGPHVREGYTDSTVYDHVSILATICARFGIRPLNARVAATNHLGPALSLDGTGARPAAPIPTASVSLSALLASLPEGATVQEELWAVLDNIDFGLLSLPFGADRRRQQEDVVRAILKHGEDLGAVHVTA